MLNTSVFKNIQDAHKKILLVTKYWNTEKTQNILWEVEEKYSDIFLALWENRIETIIEKNILRDKVHFIGNIQSQKIPEIVKYCSVIHSLSNLKHATKIENQWFPVSAFIQINLDKNKGIWISEENLAYFLQACRSFKKLKIIWISGMWSVDCSETEKRGEFQKLISLRNTHMPEWLISAGTSRDYCLALEEWIDIVRVGTKVVS
jgi:uncharacterized pyridoxal phosphate-containing UPF0001 family protein